MQRIQPDVLVLRTEHNIELSVRQKVALFCNVDIESVIESVNVPTIYDVPLKMLDEKLDITVLKKLGLPVKEDIDLSAWNGPQRRDCRAQLPLRQWVPPV